MMELTTTLFDNKFRNKLPIYCNNWTIDNTKKRCCPIVDISGHEAIIILRIKKNIKIINSLNQFIETIDSFYDDIYYKKEMGWKGRLPVSFFKFLTNENEKTQELYAECCPTNGTGIYDSVGVELLFKLNENVVSLQQALNDYRYRELSEIIKSNDVRPKGLRYVLDKMGLIIRKNKKHCEDKLFSLVNHDKKIKEVFNDNLPFPGEVKFESQLRERVSELAKSANIHRPEEL